MDSSLGKPVELEKLAEMLEQWIKSRLKIQRDQTESAQLRNFAYSHSIIIRDIQSS